MPAAPRRPLRLTLSALAALALTAGLLPGPGEAPADAASTTYDACGARLTKPDGGAWSCTFVDDFSGTALNTNKWVTQDSTKTGFTMNGTCFKPGNGYSLGGGVLKLSVARRATFDCSSPYGEATSSYLGGAVSTYGRFAQTYGRFEARMKFPAHDGPGLHGGFWMNPQDRYYGIWPGSGEIDVAEWYSTKRDHAFPSLHYTGSTGLRDTAWDCRIGDPTRFHTFAVWWTHEQMRFSYDGRVCFTREWQAIDLSKPSPFDRPFTLSLIAAAGSADNTPNGATPFPAGTVVDYVKAWT